jgi:hypothetical protein
VYSSHDPVVSLQTSLRLEKLKFELDVESASASG